MVVYGACALVLYFNEMKGRASLLAGRHRQISILLTIIAVLLWVHSILYAEFEIGHFGLIHSLPVTFFIALALLIFASAVLWIDKEKHGKLLLLQLLLVFGAVQLIPEVTGGSPSFVSQSYSNLGLTNYIAETGTFSEKQLWYLVWPGAHTLFAMITIVGSIDFGPLLSVVPLLFRLALLLPVYLLLRNIIGEERINYCWAGLLVYYLAMWVGGTYSSPQGVAFFLLLMMLALITSPYFRQKGSSRLALLSILVILTVAIVPTHMLTSLAIVLMLSVFSLVTRTKRLVPIIMLCLVLIVCWDITSGLGVIFQITSQPLWTPAMETPVKVGVMPTPRVENQDSTIEAPIPEIPERKEPSGTFTINPQTIVKTEIIGHLRGSESHIAVVKARILHSSIFALIGIAGAIYALIIRRKYEAVPILALALTPLLFLPISGHYGEELLQRVYMFSLPFMACFSALLLDVRGKLPWLILCLLLIFATPLKVMNGYGNQPMDYFPEAQVVGLKFFDNNTTHGYVTGASPLGNTSNLLQYRLLSYSQLLWQEDKMFSQAGGELPHYVAISNRDRARYGWFLGDDKYIGKIEQLLNNAVNCSLVYRNPIFILYVSDN